MTTDAPAVARSRSDARGLAVSLAQLAKPTITRMVLITTLCGALMAPVRIDTLRLGLALFGTGLVVAGANALNMLFERDVDAAMERTRDRPLPSGRLTPEMALGFGGLSAALGLGLLGFFVNPLSCLLAAAALISYAFVYTPLKRVTPYALHVGAIPGAIPPLIGWAAMAGSLALEPWFLFAILCVWQIPHFLAIAIFRQRDYEAAGLKVYPAVKGITATKRAMVGYSLLMVLVSILPLVTGVAGTLYAAIALPLGIGFTVMVAQGFAPGAGERWARRVFLASLPYLVLVFGGLVLGVLFG
jgi:protoheme IX farnesyltransferase